MKVWCCAKPMKMTIKTYGFVFIPEYPNNDLRNPNWALPTRQPSFWWVIIPYLTLTIKPLPALLTLFDEVRLIVGILCTCMFYDHVSNR